MPFSKKKTKKEDSSICEAMNISDERYDAIKDLIIDLMTGESDISQDLWSIYENLEEDNEILYALFQYGAVTGRVKQDMESLAEGLTSGLKEFVEGIERLKED